MTTIRTLPPYPDPVLDSPEDFSTKALDWSIVLPGVTADINTVAGEVAAAANAANTSASAANTSAGTAGTQAGNANTARVAAEAAAQTALNAPGTSSTSTTSLTIATGTQTFTTQTGKAWAVGQPVVIARTSAAATTYMQGTVTAYTSGTGAMSVAVASGATGGTGTFTDWTISLTGPRGSAGVLPFVTISTNTTAVASNHYQFLASCVLTLPTSPVVGDVVQFTNSSGTVTASINPGSELINATSGSMVLDKLNAAAVLKYSGATKGWVF